VPKVPVGPDTEVPLVVWLPSIAPSGTVVYDSDRIPAWKNNLFVASARRGEIDHTGALIRLVFNGKLQEIRQESLLESLHQRMRDVRQGPDGLLYVLTDEDNSVLMRISPAPHPAKCR
jgi:glucose/arabinose dehydrogenase